MADCVARGEGKLQNVSKGCRIIHFTMQEPCSWYSAMKFRNDNSFSITILLLHEETGSWEVAVSEYQLMSNPHVRSRTCEAWVVIPRHSWRHKCPAHCTIKHKVCVIMKQPSPHWKQFGILQFDFIHGNRNKNSSVIPHSVDQTLSS